MTPVDELTRDRERRLLNQSAFPGSFVSCSCERGCLCALTRASSRGRRPSRSATVILVLLAPQGFPRGERGRSRLSAPSPGF